MILPGYTGAAERLLHSKYRRLAQEHLSALHRRLFAEFTGLNFHVAWSPSASQSWTANTLPTGCAVCRKLAGRLPQKDATCRRCGPRQLARTLNTAAKGHSFTCRLKVRNYWLPLRIRGVTVGIAYLQALDGEPHRKSVPQASGPVMGLLSRQEFGRAERLLRLIVQHVQALDHAALRQEDLAKTQLALRAAKADESRLRRELQEVLPVLHKAQPTTQRENRVEGLVHGVLDRIHQEFGRGLTLQQCAQELRVNAAHLSRLFSQTVGLPFKAYLTTVQVERAQELLSNPALNISEVADSVGFASENRFRCVFKRLTGLPPRQWRETFRIDPLSPA